MGCIRQCGRKEDPYCIVQNKEGYIHPVQFKNLNPNGKYIKIMDNNFFANKKWRESIRQLQEWNQPCDFQGVDARLLNEEQIGALLSLKHEKSIKIAWDDPKEDMVKHLKRYY